VVLVQRIIIEVAHYRPIDEMSTKTDEFGCPFGLDLLESFFNLALSKY